MPIYEYACAACGHAFEEWQKMSDAPVRTCPKCKKKKVEKLISHTAFQLKGGGWYADLYSSSKPGGQKADGKESGSGAGGGAGGKDGHDGQSAKGGPEAKGASEASSSDGGGGKGTDSGSAATKKDNKGDAKDAKKKDSPKKSEARAA